MPPPMDGHLGVLLAGGSDTNVAEIRQLTWERGGSEEDTSSMNNPRVSITKVKVTGSLRVWTFQLPGTDPAQDAGQALFVVNDTVAVKFQPQGAGAGKPQLAGTIRVTKESVDQAHDGKIESTFNFELDGATDWTRTAQT